MRHLNLNMSSVQMYYNNSGVTNNSDFSDFLIYYNNAKCPGWVLYGFLASFVLGSCFNLLECLVLARSKRDGLLTIILQITLTDTLLAPVAVRDILSAHRHTHWTITDSSALCMLHNGTSTLSGTLLIHLLLCLNFHVITSWNLHCHATNRNPLTSFDSSSSECLVTRAAAVNRKRVTGDVSVVLPVIFLWVLSVSVSMPVYVLSGLVNVDGRVICTLMQSFHGKWLSFAIMFFGALLPSVLLLLSLLLLLHKLKKSNRNAAELKQFDDLKRLLVAAVVLTSCYVITSYQRHVFSVFFTIREVLFNGDYYYRDFLNVYQVMWHYSGTGLRGLIFYLLGPGVRKSFREQLFCYRNKV